jgi:hypothetical protein
MPKVSSYAQRTRKLTIEFAEDDDDPLHLVYYPRAITPRMERAFQELQASGQADQIIYDSLGALIQSWDLTNEFDEEIPRTREGLEDLPSSLLLHVFEKISEDIRPNSARSSTSLNGSVPTASEDRALIGSSFSD